MRTSLLRTPAAVLRAIIGIKAHEMAELLHCSVSMIHSMEAGDKRRRKGRRRVTDAMAMKMFHETGISPTWILAGNEKDPPLTATGEPYSRFFFQEAQARKRFYDQPHEFFKLTNQLAFAATVTAILESAYRGKNYYMARYKIGETLTKLRGEFGQDADVYPASSFTPDQHVHFVDNKKAVALLVPVVDFGRKEIRKAERELRALTAQSSARSSRHPKRPPDRA
jgi:hypothetical protein